jgi:hypothetical protein
LTPTTLLFAAFTGLLLFASSLIAGWTAPADGPHYLLTRSYGDAFGPDRLYSVGIREACTDDAFEHDDDQARARPLAVGAPVEAHSHCEDADWVSFEAAAGTTYVISTSGLVDDDTLIVLYDVAGVELGRDVALPQPTVHRYLNLLETSYLLLRIPAFARNRTKRLIKSPKLYWGDTGVALHLSGSDEPGGAHLENVILNDLLAWRDSSEERIDLHYWRTVTGEEVDFVVEAGERLIPIEVKATTRPRLADAAGLLAFRSEYGRTARAGLLLHAGNTIQWLAPSILAVPWWRVL